MRSFHSIAVGSLLLALAGCSKSTKEAPAEGGAATTDAAAAPATGDAAAAAPAPAADAPAPRGAAAPAAVATEFPSKEELVVLVEKVKVFEGQAKAGKLDPKALEAFMQESKNKFPPSIEPPRGLIEGDAEFQAAQGKLMDVMKGLSPQDMQNPEKQKEIESKLAPITLQLMRRTFEILIEADWQPPAPGAAPAKPAAAPQAPAKPAPAAK